MIELDAHLLYKQQKSLSLFLLWQGIGEFGTTPKIHLTIWAHIA